MRFFTKEVKIALVAIAGIVILFFTVPCIVRFTAQFRRTRMLRNAVNIIQGSVPFGKYFSIRFRKIFDAVKAALRCFT